MARLSRFEAADILQRCNAADSDFHTLPSSAVDALLDFADSHGYRKPRHANGSRGRYWHAYLQRLASNRFIYVAHRAMTKGNR